MSLQSYNNNLYHLIIQTIIIRDIPQILFATLCVSLSALNLKSKHPCYLFSYVERALKGLTMIFAGQENPFIIFRSKEMNIYFKTNIKIPINLLK